MRLSPEIPHLTIKEGLYRFFLYVLSIFIILSTIGGLSAIYSRLVFVSYLLGALYCLVHIKRIDIKSLLFLLYLPLNILIADPNPIFRSWERLGVFSMLFIMSSPLIQSHNTRLFRNQLLRCLLELFVFISIVSFFCYFIGINLFEDRYYGGYLSDYYESAGHFSGITKHSMLLGPIAGLSVIYLLDRILKRSSLWSFVALLLCSATLLFSASRAALLATLGGVATAFISTIRNTRNSSRVILLVVVVLVASFPFYRAPLSSVINKHQNVEVGRFDTRSGKVEARILEFQQSPIVGVGFSALDPSADDFDFVSGSIEPGSSWLAILSMTGIVGVVLFLLIFIKSYRSVLHSRVFMNFALIVFFVIHMLVEGYVFSSGNVMSCFLWLTIGCCYDYRSDIEINCNV